MNFEEKAANIVGDIYGWHMKNDALEAEITIALREAYELGRSELNAHDKSRAKVLLELSEAKARIEELETALVFYADHENWDGHEFIPWDCEEAPGQGEHGWEEDCYKQRGKRASTALAKRGKGE